jgi:hypothetical protein
VTSSAINNFGQLTGATYDVEHCGLRIAQGGDVDGADAAQPDHPD